jgi:hypothetical protein
MTEKEDDKVGEDFVQAWRIMDEVIGSILRENPNLNPDAKETRMSSQVLPAAAAASARRPLRFAPWLVKSPTFPLETSLGPRGRGFFF